LVVVQTGSGYRIYCASAAQPHVLTIYSEYSQDGIHFQPEGGNRMPAQLDPSLPFAPTAVYDLPDGRHRMLLMVTSTPPNVQPFDNVVYGATSTDWLNWTLDSKSVLVSNRDDRGNQGWPTVVRWRGQYFMVYWTRSSASSAFSLGKASVGQALILATSQDGLSFTRLQEAGIYGSESAPIAIPDGRISLVYNTACCPSASDTIGSSQLEVAVLTSNQ
jgi:hypothetical protein